ncbi:sensor domain-containing diguanylate cyclase [Neorhizobium sp. S3-V5DH]|uniref:GGDEF domain-containing protein n=1 Tax=Neorhizobium sp. S3-V5DH TaxID=2485166 RepID=UPI0010D83068|nr:sensor domain-containing diguanylate cyclase [Neorhizobium sp. S3-V5DH]TCV75932.1 PAS domain S-box-containing protein/diguanylate cyclase (GGDEF)-like protein [Neorhizobium sp. S3-V5DH]
MMLDLMPMGLLIHTRQGIIFGNQEAARLLQVPQSEVVGKHFLDFLTTHAEEAAQQMEEAFDGRISVEPTEAEVRTAAGATRTIKLIAGALPWEGNPVVQLLLQDITDLKMIQQRLHLLAVTDELTGAFNRRHAFQMGHALFREVEAAPTGIALAVLDVDHFKRVNDTYGHTAGDAALKALTQSVQEFIAAEAAHKMTFARVGGEEFMILFTATEPEAVVEVCEQIRREIEKRLVLSTAGSFKITVSIGVAVQNQTDSSFDTLYSSADRALYEAKSAGRNRVCRHDAGPQPRGRSTAT